MIAETPKKIHVMAVLAIALGSLITIGSWYFQSASSPEAPAPGNPAESIIPAVSSPVRATSRCRIVALGDSITAGNNLDLADAYPAQLEKILRKNGYDCVVVNAGISGDTSKVLLERMDFTLGEDAYDLAILTIGGNDGLQTLPIGDLRKNISEIIEKLRAKKIPIVLSGMQIPNNAGAYALEFRKIYPELAKEFQMPIYPFFLE